MSYVFLFRYFQISLPIISKIQLMWSVKLAHERIANTADQVESKGVAFLCISNSLCNEGVTRDSNFQPVHRYNSSAEHEVRNLWRIGSVQRTSTQPAFHPIWTDNYSLRSRLDLSRRTDRPVSSWERWKIWVYINNYNNKNTNNNIVYRHTHNITT